MPKFLNQNADGSMQNFTAADGSFTFSAVRPDALTETEYTLVSIVTDITGSVEPFANNLLDALKSAVNSCKKAPKSENILVRALQFNSGIGVKEIHGFKNLNEIDVDKDYLPFNCGGMTSLYDATFDAVASTVKYGQLLSDQDYTVNAIMFIITDGVDNASRVTPSMIRDQVAKVTKEEKLESMITVLVGINTQDGICSYVLNKFKDEANLTQYIDVGEASPGKLAKLCAFISRSISSTSTSLGNPNKSQQLVF